MRGIKSHLKTATLFVSAAKGIETGTLVFPTDIIAAELKALAPQIVSLSGPSFATEICAGLPTCVSLASIAPAAAQTAQALLHAPHFRCYTSNDCLGLEVAGALKNIIAIASGASWGLGYQNNTQAALVTRGLAEIMRLGAVLGADPLTFTGLGGVGDLFLTCTSPKSRNYQVGFQLAQGVPLAQIIKEMGSTAEGIATATSAAQLAARHQVDMPIVSEVHKVLHEGKSIRQAVQDLLTRDAKPELTLPT